MSQAPTCKGRQSIRRTVQPRRKHREKQRRVFNPTQGVWEGFLEEEFCREQIDYVSAAAILQQLLTAAGRTKVSAVCTGPSSLTWPTPCSCSQPHHYPPGPVVCRPPHIIAPPLCGLCAIPWARDAHSVLLRVPGQLSHQSAWHLLPPLRCGLLQGRNLPSLSHCSAVCPDWHLFVSGCARRGSPAPHLVGTEGRRGGGAAWVEGLS